jgi:hypothetical protein
VAKDGLVAVVLYPSHSLDKVGAAIEPSSRRSSQGALCYRDRPWDDRVLLVVPIRVRRCGVRFGRQGIGIGRDA